MAEPITVDIPEPLLEKLQHQAECSGTTVPALIIRAIERQIPPEQEKGAYVTGPMVKATKDELGPRFPVDETPYDLAFP